MRILALLFRNSYFAEPLPPFQSKNGRLPLLRGMIHTNHNHKIGQLDLLHALGSVWEVRKNPADVVSIHQHWSLLHMKYIFVEMNLPVCRACGLPQMRRGLAMFLATIPELHGGFLPDILAVLNWWTSCSVWCVPLPIHRISYAYFGDNLPLPIR